MYPRKENPFFVKSSNLIISNKVLQQIKPNLPNEEGTRSLFNDVMTEFSKKSTIHGLLYIGDRKRNWIERLWWMIAFSLSLALCVSSIFSIWWKWEKALIVLGSHHKLLPIHEVPFPAITICPTTKFSTNKFNYTDVYRAMLKLDGNQSRNVTEVEYANGRTNMNVACQVCNEQSAKDIYNLSNDSTADNTIVSTLCNLAPNFDDTVVRCAFSDRLTNCSKLFYPIKTEEGICYTFNTWNRVNMMSNETVVDPFDESTKQQPPSDWKTDRGYDRLKTGEQYPYRVFGTGPHFSLKVVLKLFDYDIDYLCGGDIQGFKLMFHLPHEQPQLRKNFFYISPGRTALFKVSPNLIVSMDAIKRYSPSTRHCFLKSERPLRFFNEYTQQNCEMECLANYTMAQCDCVRFAMPRAKEDKTKVCGPAKLECCNNANKKIFQDGLQKCNCLPRCSSLSYSVDVTQARYHYAEYIYQSKYRDVIEYANSTFSRLVISFQDDRFIPQQRAESNNLIDILGQTGGIFGLCMGASVLSFFELFYYLTLRMFFMRQKRCDFNRTRF